MTGLPLNHNGGPPLRDGNWISVSRELIEHHIVGAGNCVTPADKNRGSFSRLESWLDLLCMANFKERKLTVHGVTVVLTPGQTVAGRAFLAKRWNWSEKTVRIWLAKLQTELMITLACEELKQGQTKGHMPNVLSVCNWWKYQIGIVDQGPDLGRPQGHLGATSGPHLNKETKEQDKERKKKDKDGEFALAAGAAPAPIEALKAFEAYNDLAQRVGLPVATTMTPARRRSILARLREHGGHEAWERMLANVARSAYLQGSKGWVPPGIDWFIKPANFVKVFEGAYGNGAHAAPAESYVDRMRRLMGHEHSERPDVEILPPERRL